MFDENFYAKLEQETKEEDDNYEENSMREMERHTQELDSHYAPSVPY